MDGLLFAVEALVVIGAIVMGSKSSGVALGIWGGVGVTVLVFVFGLEPGSPPVDAILIILSVILAAATMQVAGGIDWMVVMAARAIVKHPKQVTIIAPFMSFLFCLGAGTGNIVYPLLPVIYDVSYQAKIRPERPLVDDSRRLRHRPRLQPRLGGDGSHDHPDGCRAVQLRHGQGALGDHSGRSDRNHHQRTHHDAQGQGPRRRS